MQEKLSERVPLFPLNEALAPKEGEVEGDLSELGNLIDSEPSKDTCPSRDDEVSELNQTLIKKLKADLDDVTNRLIAMNDSQPIQDQEIRSSIERPTGTESDVSVERQPKPPARLAAPGRAEQAECTVMHESNPSDAMARYRSTIKELLATLSTIAGATARPSDELSAIAQTAIRKHSKSVN
jgi:hypothetical protein